MRSSRRPARLAPPRRLMDPSMPRCPLPASTSPCRASFANGINARYSSGPFGHGWQMGWDLTLTAENGPSAGTRGRVSIADSSGSARLPARLPRPHRSQVLLDGRRRVDADEGRRHLRAAQHQRHRHPLPLADRGADQGRIDWVQDTNGNRISAGYDASGRMESLTHPNGADLALAYNAAGRRRDRVTDPAGPGDPLRLRRQRRGSRDRPGHRRKRHAELPVRHRTGAAGEQVLHARSSRPTASRRV